MTTPICSFCKWTNGEGLLNIADPLTDPRWICHGCVKRELERLRKALKNIHAMSGLTSLMPEVINTIAAEALKEESK